MKKRRMRISTQAFAIVAVLLLGVNAALGFLMTRQSSSAMKTLMHARMLDISNTAADMIDGDVLASLTAEDADSEAYRRIMDALTVFQDNIDLRYIYCITEKSEGEFVFSVDPTIEDPGEFGSPIVYTDALNTASNGTPAVDDKPYKDNWGEFYSAYSPVFDSAGKVAGIVAVDFDAAWYETRLRNSAIMIASASVASLLIGAFIVGLYMGQIRKRLYATNAELAALAGEIDELTQELKPSVDGITPDAAETASQNELADLGRKIRASRGELRRYINDTTTRANRMITALASDYRSVYYVDLDSDEGICYRSSLHTPDALREGETFAYQETFRRYAERYVAPSDREEFLRFADPDVIRQNLEDEALIAFRYLTVRDGVEQYEMLRMSGVRRPEDRDDNTVHAIGVGFTDVDSQTREAMRRNRALTEALDAAEESNKAKTAFLSGMSHEIRTPMNAIIGLDTIALTDSALSDKTREYLEQIGDSARHLLQIINDVLDMSRVESGRLYLRDEPFSLAEEVRQINGIIRPQCAEKGIRYECRIGDGADGRFVGDDGKLRQALINILGNAVKFTPEGGEVAMQIERTAHFDDRTTLRFTVRDTGIGMDESFLPHIYDAFSQEDASAINRYGSTGLGMAITKSIVDMMNGKIDVQSAKGKGTTFTVTLTFRDDVQPNDGDGAPQELPPGQQELEGRRVLLAEDMAVNAEIMTMILGMRGVTAELAENGRIAVEMFTSHPAGYYDAILMDMRMPEMDGLTATAAIRASGLPDAASIPIIALTANAFDEDVQRSLQAGLNAHLSKPVEPEKLFATLESLIA